MGLTVFQQTNKQNQFFMVFLVFQWILVELFGYIRLLNGFDCFTEYYWIILGFTGFY